MKQPTKPCHCCNGTGREKLSPAYTETLKVLRKGRATGAQISRELGVQATAVNNRLAKLEEFGLARSEWTGRERYYTATNG